MTRLDFDESRIYEDLNNKNAKSHLIVQITSHMRVKKILPQVRIKKIPPRVFVKKTANRGWTQAHASTLQDPSSYSSQDSINESSLLDDYVTKDENSLEEDTLSEIIALFESIIALLENSPANSDDGISLIQQAS